MAFVSSLTKNFQFVMSSSADSLKTLHQTIKKVTEDIEQFSFNTCISAFMICVNELSSQKCNHRSILEPLAILLSPFAVHLAEELWERLGHNTSISTVPYLFLKRSIWWKTQRTILFRSMAKCALRTNYHWIYLPKKLRKSFLQRSKLKIPSRENPQESDCSSRKNYQYRRLMLIELIGYFAAFLTTAAFVPQAYKISKEKSLKAFH